MKAALPFLGLLPVISLTIWELHSARWSANLLHFRGKKTKSTSGRLDSMSAMGTILFYVVDREVISVEYLLDIVCALRLDNTAGSNEHWENLFFNYCHLEACLRLRMACNCAVKEKSALRKLQLACVFSFEDAQKCSLKGKIRLESADMPFFLAVFSNVMLTLWPKNWSKQCSKAFMSLLN